MPTSTNVTNLKINELTEAQYDAAVLNGTIGANELSVLTDAQVGQIIQVSSMPTASADELGNIYQFIGTTDANYTNGYFYKCVSDGQTPATYSWTRVDVQPTPSELPSQTGNAGRFLTTDGTDVSWKAVTVTTTATLVAADWSSNAQTITVQGVTTTNVVFVSPDPASLSDYASAGITCVSQGTDSLTFNCVNVPSNAITVSIVML